MNRHDGGPAFPCSNEAGHAIGMAAATVTLRPSCYRGKGYVRVKPEALDSAGYWRR